MYTSARAHRPGVSCNAATIYEAAIGRRSQDDLDHQGPRPGARRRFRSCCRTRCRFADSLAAAYHAACGERIVVTSGARPIDEQPRNASPKSVHPTGMAVDFQKADAIRVLAWMRTNLLQLEDAHVIEATEERHPPHFHVAVLHQSAEQRGCASRARFPTPSSAGGTTRSANGDVADVRNYTVRAGDNLWTIAHRYGSTSDGTREAEPSPQLATSSRPGARAALTRHELVARDLSRTRGGGSRGDAWWRGYCVTAYSRRQPLLPQGTRTSHGAGTRRTGRGHAHGRRPSRRRHRQLPRLDARRVRFFPRHLRADRDRQGIRQVRHRDGAHDRAPRSPFARSARSSSG